MTNQEGPWEDHILYHCVTDQCCKSGSVLTLCIAKVASSCRFSIELDLPNENQIFAVCIEAVQLR